MSHLQYLDLILFVFVDLFSKILKKRNVLLLILLVIYVVKQAHMIYMYLSFIFPENEGNIKLRQVI